MIEFFVHEMDGAAGDFDAIVEGLLPGFEAGKGGEEGWMDVDDAIGEGADHLMAQPARAKMHADPGAFLFILEQVDVVIAGADRAQLVARQPFQVLQPGIRPERAVEQGVVDPAHHARENERFYREYQAGTLDIHEYAAFALQSLVDHELGFMESLRARFISVRVEPIVAAGSRRLLDRHRTDGDLLVITTATNRFIVEPIAALLGIDHLIATDPEIVDGRYTGRIAGIPNFQGGKVARLRSWISEQQLPCRHMVCYSDSHNDIPLLEMAQRAVAVDPDPVLRSVAERRGWDVISLR
mgnify:CR=1 FL=1